MITLHQLVKNKRVHKIKWSSTVKLNKCPMRKGIVAAIFTGSPKKPNSGKRKLAKVALSTGKNAIVTIPDGSQFGGPALQRYSRVLVRGGRARDMPGAHYKIIRSTKGRIQDTMGGSARRKQRRSKFGTIKLL